jgi:hypothetical protein
VLSYKFSFVCGQDLYLIRIYANKFDKHARKCVFLTNLYHILACASKSCKQNARCIGALTDHFKAQMENHLETFYFGTFFGN